SSGRIQESNSTRIPTNSTPPRAPAILPPCLDPIKLPADFFFLDRGRSSLSRRRRGRSSSLELRLLVRSSSRLRFLGSSSSSSSCSTTRLDGAFLNCAELLSDSGCALNGESHDLHLIVFPANFALTRNFASQSGQAITIV